MCVLQTCTCWLDAPTPLLDAVVWCQILQTHRYCAIWSRTALTCKCRHSYVLLLLCAQIIELVQDFADWNRNSPNLCDWPSCPVQCNYWSFLPSRIWTWPRFLYRNSNITHSTDHEFQNGAVRLLTLHFKAPGALRCRSLSVKKQIKERYRANNYKALLRKMTYEEHLLPPCSHPTCLHPRHPSIFRAFRGLQLQKYCPIFFIQNIIFLNVEPFILSVHLVKHICCKPELLVETDWTDWRLFL